jgi:hypothetical protein
MKRISQGGGVKADEVDKTIEQYNDLHSKHDVDTRTKENFWMVHKFYDMVTGMRRHFHRSRVAHSRFERLLRVGLGCIVPLCASRQYRVVQGVSGSPSAPDRAQAGSAPGHARRRSGLRCGWTGSRDRALLWWPHHCALFFFCRCCHASGCSFEGVISCRAATSTSTS